MPNFKVMTSLFHNNTEFKKGDIISLTTEESKALLEVHAIETTNDTLPPEAPGKPVDRFSAPSSTSEIEKAAQSAVLAPIRRGRCPKCKAEREIKNAQIFQDTKKTGATRLIGECAICGTRISRISGRIKIEAEKK